MKICIEISNKHLMAAYGMLMTSYINDEEKEQRLTETVESLKVSTEPVELDIKEIADDEASVLTALVLSISVINKKME